MLLARSWLGSPSLPSRGAWIEISLSAYYFHQVMVAPLTGSVD